MAKQRHLAEKFFFATLFLKRGFFLPKLSGPFWNPRLPLGQSSPTVCCRIFQLIMKEFPSDLLNDITNQW